MLAMERLPLSQSPFSGSLSLSSPIVQSPRAGVPAPLIQGLPSPPALHTSHQQHTAAIAGHPGTAAPPGTIPKVRPGSSSSLSSVHTPPPYGDTTLMGSAGPPVYSPTHSSSLLPPASAEHHERLACHVVQPSASGAAAAAADLTRHGLTPLPSLTSLIGHHQSMPIVSSAQETTCGSVSSPVTASREQQSLSPSGESIVRSSCDLIASYVAAARYCGVSPSPSTQ